MDYPYWHKQSKEKPLFPDIEWSKPQQKAYSGRLGIIGGSNLGFAGLAEMYQTALKTGAGEVKVLLPNSLKKNIPSSMLDVVYAPDNASGGMSKDAITQMNTIGAWSTGIILGGDAGRNSETAILYEQFVQHYQGPLIITRDAIDLIKNDYNNIANRDNTLLIVSFSQLQKMFQLLYYPKVLTFSMQLTNLVENLHKFTITYPVSVAVFHKDTMLLSNKGVVTTTAYDNPMAVWRGITAAKAATYWIWNQSKLTESVTASFIV